jgi:hypothetical protein
LHTGKGADASEGQEDSKESVVLVGILEGSLYALPATRDHSSTGIVEALLDYPSLPLAVAPLRSSRRAEKRRVGSAAVHTVMGS